MPDPNDEDDRIRLASSYHPLPTYRLPPSRPYPHQFADMYFARLAQLKPAVEAVAGEAWTAVEIAPGLEKVRRVDRVLDVRQGELCWVAGTVYMDMPLKPNVLEDLGKEGWVAAPPSRVKYQGEREGGQKVMLEDESGRLRLTGTGLAGCMLVTGAIVAVVGTENRDGEFEVVDLRVADLPRQPMRWEMEHEAAAVNEGAVVRGEHEEKTGKVAIVSGLGISGDDAADSLTLDLLMEYLLGESASKSEQDAVAQITRLIIAGDSLAHASPILSREDVAAAKRAGGIAGMKKYGYDSSAYNAAPTERLDMWLSSLLPSLPITLIPGPHDPTGTALPQQPLHPALFPHSRAYMSPTPTSTPSKDKNTNVGWLDAQTNPTVFDLAGLRFLGTGGQPVDDIYRYLPFGVEERIEMMEAMLRWRLVAPTAPDTLWCYPFPAGDPFVLQECPHVFFAGNQPKFEKGLIEGPAGQVVRLIAVPKFSETGEVVLLDLESLECEVVKFELFDGKG